MAKELDITKTGPVKWRQLQEANALNTVGNDSAFEEWMSGLKAASAPTSLFDPVAQAEKEIDSPLKNSQTHTGKQDYWGNSAFDSKIANEYEFRRLSDVRAENQPWISKLTNGVGKAGVLALTTAAEGLLGVPYGLVAAPFTGKFSTIWDNHITRVLQDIRDYSEEYMPNYYTEDEMKNPFSHIFTANFLGDKLLKNLGFMVGAFYSGIPVAEGLGALGRGAVKAAKAARLAEEAGMAERAGQIAAEYGDDIISKAAQYGREVAGLSDDAAAKVASKYGEDAVNLHNALAAEKLTEAERKARILAGMEKVNNIAQTTRYTTQTLGALASAINEGAIEAIDNSRDWARMQKQVLDDKYQKEISEIQQQLGDSPEGQDAMLNAQAKYEQELAAIEEGRAAVGNADLLLNIPILTASNIFQLGRLYNRGFDSARREMGSGLFHPKIAGELKLGSSNLHSTKTWKGAVGMALAKSNSEGLEEYLQRAASDGAGNAVSDTLQRFFTGGQSEDTNTSITDYITSFGRAMINNLSDDSAKEEYLIGALSSLLGMPTFGKGNNRNAWAGKDKIVGISGGFLGNYNEYMDQKAKEDKVAEYLNGRLNDPDFMAMYNAFKKNGDLDKAIMEAVIEKDKAKYKDIEFEKLFNDINAAASSGHFEEFKAIIGYANDYSDEELKEIAESTTHKVSAEDQRNADIARRDYIQGKIDWYEANGITTEAERANVYNYQQELDELNSRLAGEYQDGKLLDIEQSTQYKDKEVGPFVMTNANGNVIHMYLDGDENDPESGKSKMINILESNRKNILQAMDDYLRIRNNIDIETDGHLEDKDISILTLMKAKILNIDSRSADMWRDIQDNLSAVSGDAFAAEAAVLKNVAALENKIKEAKTESEKVAAEVELENFKKKYGRALSIANLMRSLSVKTDASLNEQIAHKKGLTGKSWLSSAASVVGTKINDILEREGDEDWTESKRPLNTEELQILLAHPDNAVDLIKGIKAATSIDNFTKERLIDEVGSLSYLAKQKVLYNQKVREYLGDPSLIHKDAQSYEDKLSKENKDNITNELSLRMQKAKNMMELDSILREAFATSGSIADAALQKARESKDPAVKAMMDDYSKSRKYFTEFNNKAAELPSNLVDGITDTMLDSWQSALADSSEGTLYDKFLKYLNEAVGLLKEEGNKGNNASQRYGEELEKIMSDIAEAQQASATNNDTLETPSKKDKVKKSGVAPKSIKSGKKERRAVRSDDAGDGDEVSEYKKKFKEATTLEALDNLYMKASAEGLGNSLKEAYEERAVELGRVIAQEDTSDTIKKAITDAITAALNNDKFIASIDALPDAVSQRVKKYNNQQTDDNDKITNAFVAQLLKEATDAKIKREAFEEPDDEDIDDSDTSEVADRMVAALRSNYTSDGHTKYKRYDDSGNERLYYKSIYPQDKQGKAIVQFLEDNHAFDFMDRNLLGYLFKYYNEKDEAEDLPIYFVKSTSDDVNDSDTSSHVIFLAIKLTPNDIEVLKSKSGNSDLDGILRLEHIGDSDYQIVGELSMVQEAVPEVQNAFMAFQEQAGNRLNRKIEEVKEKAKSGEKIPSFVMFTDNEGNPIVSYVNDIYTGRLEKSHEGKDDASEKRNLYDFVSESTEWESQGMEFPFGVVVNGAVEEIPGTQAPNSSWMNKHNGAIVMFVPKPDGVMYPIRCTRRSVSDWLKSNGDFLPKGEDMLEQVLSGGTDNEYLNEIIDLIKTLLNEDTSEEEWVRAKYLLSQFFVFGSTIPIHGGPGNISFSFFDNGSLHSDQLDTEDDEENTKIKAFFEMLGRHNVLFSMPSTTKRDFDSRDIVMSGVFETGLKGFYNFNSNFTIDPINSHGERITVTTDPKLGDDAGRGMDFNRGAIEYSIDGTTRAYFIKDGIAKRANGSEIEEQEANLVLMAHDIYEGNRVGRSLVIRTIDKENIPNADIKNEVVSHFQNSAYKDIFIIESDGVNWVYDRRGGGKTNVIYRLDSKEGKELQKEIFKELREFISHAAVKYTKTGKNKPKGKKGTVSKDEQPIVEEGKDKLKDKKEKKKSKIRRIQMNPDEPASSEYIFIGKSLDDLDPKSSTVADILVTRGGRNKKSKEIAESILVGLQTREADGEDTTSNEVADEIKKIFDAKPKERKALLEDFKSCKKA